MEATRDVNWGVTVILIACLHASTSIGDDAPANRRLSVDVHAPRPLGEFISFLAAKAEYTTVFATGAVVDASTGAQRAVDWIGQFNDAEVRYPLSWTLYLGSLNVSLSNRTMYVFPHSGRNPTLPERLLAYSEPPPRGVTLQTYLGTRNVSLPKSRLEATVVVEWLCSRNGVSTYVFDPEIAAKHEMITVDVVDAPPNVVLLQLMEDLGWQCDLQGGGLYFRHRRR